MAGRHLRRAASGHLIATASGHLALEEEAAWVDCYKLNGYTDGDLGACAICFDSGSDAWDGTFYRIVDAQPRWNVDAIRRIDGKDLVATSFIVRLQPGGGWRVSINCSKAGPNEPIWVGDKAIGMNPTGVYTRTLGCDLTATMTVVEC